MVPRGRTARPGDLEPFRVARALHGDVEGALGDGLGGPGANPAVREEAERPRTAPDREEIAPGGGERACDEMAELAGADHDHPILRSDLHLLLDLQRGGGGLGEDGDVVGHNVRDCVEIGDGEGQMGGERTVSVHDAQHRPPLAVRGPTGLARGTRAAHGVDLADHAAPCPLRRPRGLLDHADELVPRDPRVGVIALNEFQIGVADACHAHPHEGPLPAEEWGQSRPRAE